MADPNTAIEGALETVKGLFNSFTNAANRELVFAVVVNVLSFRLQFRKEAIAQLQRSESHGAKDEPGADGEPPSYAAPDLSKVIHEGQLLKKGDWRWHKRFCVLDGLYFRVFNDKGELKPKYVIPLIRLTQVRREAQNRFIVTPFPEDGPPLVLEAEPARVSEWLLAFQRAREICFPDEPPPAATSSSSGGKKGGPVSAFDIEKSFVDLLLTLKDPNPIAGLGALGAEAPSRAEATAEFGMGEEARQVPVIVAPPTGDNTDRVAVCAFKFAPSAAILKLNLDCSSLKAEPARIIKSENSTELKPDSGALTVDDQRFLTMDHQPVFNDQKSDVSPNATIIEMESNVLHSIASPRSPGSPELPDGLSKKEAKAQLAELRTRRKAGEISEEQYKEAKRALLDKLAEGSANQDAAVNI